MRKFIIKYLFGRYFWKFPFQYHYNYTARGPFWYFNGFLLIGLIWMATGRPEWMLLWPMVAWFLIVLYFGFPLFGFSYFEKYPVKWEELEDEEQKWYYGVVATYATLRKKVPFTPEQFEEWAKIRAKMYIKYRLGGTRK